MPKKTRIKRTYSFRKLQKKFPFIVADAVNVIGRRLVKSIMDGVDRGVDVNGKPFEPLSANTKALGGNKPLKRSGKMKDGLTKKPATVQDLKFVIDATATSRGEIYGAFHNQGYKNSYKKKQWFKGATIPKREWFGIPMNMKSGGSELKKAMREIHPRVASAWRKIAR